jgi:hypothetical protein
MTDSGLSTRLRQQSRRAGLMVGITMVLTIAICIFGAAMLFAWLSRPFSDLIPVAAPAASVARQQAQPDAPAEPGASDAPVIETQDAVPTESTNAAPPVVTQTTATEAFEPTHQIRPGDSINFRSGPSTSDPIIVALSPATPLQFLDDEEPTTNPSDGERWMKFRTEDGQEGWVREIDTEAYEP